MSIHFKRDDPAHPICFRTTGPKDGMAVWQLVQNTGTLEVNSAYAYVLLTSDFADTCLVAEQDGQLLAALIAYHPPRQADTAFVWQIGVHPSQQGRGLGLQMLRHWLAQPANAQVRWITATVADDNSASRALFQSLARELGCKCEIQPHFLAEHFPAGHADEPLLRIGPINGPLSAGWLSAKSLHLSNFADSLAP